MITWEQDCDRHLGFIGGKLMVILRKTLFGMYSVEINTGRSEEDNISGIVEARAKAEELFLEWLDKNGLMVRPADQGEG